MNALHPNPWGRKYTKAEIAAAGRIGFKTFTRQFVDPYDGMVEMVLAGPLIYASPTTTRLIDYLREQAQDRLIVAAAMEREWAKKELADE